MGTSSSHGSPSGGGLLPSWYDDEQALDQPPQVQPEPELAGEGVPLPSEQPVPVIPAPDPGADPSPFPTVDWGGAKGAFTRYVNRTSGSSLSKASGAYVRAMGGASRAARAARRGAAAGGRLARFLGRISGAGGGFNEALQAFGLSNLVGRSTEEVLAHLANAIAPDGATNDEAIARDAVLATLDRLCERRMEDDGNFEPLENLTPDDIRSVMIEYVNLYIFNKWVYELGVAIETNAVSELDAVQLEAEVRDFVFEEVTNALQDVPLQSFSLDEVRNQQIIQTIFLNAYATLSHEDI
ncbi:MAG: Qat anti-phage system associated protein QatB [Flavisolibacter sp.]